MAYLSGVFFSEQSYSDLSRQIKSLFSTGLTKVLIGTNCIVLTYLSKILNVKVGPGPPRKKWGAKPVWTPGSATPGLDSEFMRRPIFNSPASWESFLKTFKHFVIEPSHYMLDHHNWLSQRNAIVAKQWRLLNKEEFEIASYPAFEL